MTAPDPPAGYTTRPASLADADAIADLQNETNLAEVGFPWTDAEEIRDELTAPGRDPDDDVVVLAADGSVACYLTLSAAESDAMAHQLVFVRPALWGRGLSMYLLRLGEERARAGGRATVLGVSRWATNDAAGDLFTALGYRYARTFRTLRMELSAMPRPAPPSGISIRIFDRASDDEAVHAALAEAFEDHWGSFAFPTYERWVHEAFEGVASGFDADLWFVATDGGGVVGAVCARRGTARDPAVGQVDYLGVRRAWRGRGIGRTLLLETFGALADRGVSSVELGVDSDSPTGAQRLYEAVGMRTAYAYEVWRKEL